MTTKTTPKKASGQHVLRFAHPFFTDTPAAKTVRKAIGANSMKQYIANNLEPIPAYGNAPLTMTLSDIVGNDAAKEIEDSSRMSFHIVGDTGAPLHDMQQPIANLMQADYDFTKDHTQSPSFMLHLGDVIYYNNTTEGYHEQFYEPYKKYPGKIIAIPGNHDGEMFKYNQKNQPPTGQKFSLAAFIDNFCRSAADVPPAAGTIYRQVVAQPGVYWWLQSELVDIIGLYSNVAEGPGYIVTQTDDSQKKWLAGALKKVAAQRNVDDASHKALIIAVHHPPYSAAGHESSTDMLGDIDECCSAAGILPDAFISGHAHNYQHFERQVKCNGKTVSVPCLVVGCSGHNADPVVANNKTLGKPIPANVDVGKNLDGYGYMVATIGNGQLSFQFYQVTVDQNHVATKTAFDSASVVLTGSNVGTLQLD